MSILTFDLLRRTRSTPFRYGDLVAPTPPNGKIYLCTTPGTSAAGVIAFATGAGSVTSDNAVRWTECTPAGLSYWGPIEVSANPKYGDYERGRKYVQPIDYSVGGDVYSYDKGNPAKNIRSFTLTNLTPENMQALLDFIDLVRGSKFSWILTDVDGTTHRALLLNPDEITTKPDKGGRENLSAIKVLFL